MTRRNSMVLAAAAAAGVALLMIGCSSTKPATPQSKASFFVTSSNPGKGADFGGLAGADRVCQSLATAVGAGGRTWRAYLSTSAAAGAPAVNARDRIGTGPWYNVKGELIAANVDELHGANKLTKQTALTEKGDGVSGRGDPVNMHDILTGSTPDGRASSDAKDTTCGNWTKGGDGSAIVGHHDRTGLDESAPAKSWNSSHATQGCSLDALKKTGGNGLLFCFAQN
ncbi:hypothetical protein QTI33_06300 [Variovorax sp. J22P271]|uniref:hypothetical protein n=1 Tax=Variovorax davisae TaxID=3053515 RepID=UPI002574EF56|nr:hypothetical protein [Variovorax sp. J22P271]MDM0031754.1 hypothetical protein [Variovorax sp. J22P271]